MAGPSAGRERPEAAVRRVETLMRLHSVKSQIYTGMVKIYTVFLPLKSVSTAGAERAFSRAGAAARAGLPVFPRRAGAEGEPRGNSGGLSPL